MEESPRDRRQARTRQDIINKAFDVIRETGLAKFSLREVARRADFSPAGLYEYFNDKDDLILAVSNECRDRILPALQAVSTDMSADAYILELSLAFLRYARSEPTYIQLLSRENTTTVQNFESYRPEDIEADEITRLFHAGLQRGIKDGIFQANDAFGALEMFYGLWTMAIGMILVQINLFGPQAFDFETVDRMVVETFLRGLSLPPD